jgi:hypothetical protein
MTLLNFLWKLVRKAALAILFVFGLFILFAILAGPPIDLLLQSPISPLLARIVGSMIGISLMGLLYAGYNCFPVFEERSPRIANRIKSAFWLGSFVGFASSRQDLLNDLQLGQYGTLLRMSSLVLIVVAAAIPVIRYVRPASRLES